MNKYVRFDNWSDRVSVDPVADMDGYDAGGPMKVVFVYKWARSESDALVRADGTIDWRNAKMSTSEDDPAALAAAKQLAGDEGSIVGLTIGDGDASWALARGVEEAVSVAEVPPLTDNVATAEVIGKAIESIKAVDVVCIGDSKQDPGVSVALAGQLEWPALAGLRTAFLSGGKVNAVRKVGDNLETFAVSTPCVLGFSAESDVDVVPGMKERLAARKRPITPMEIESLGGVPRDLDVVATEATQTTDARVFEGDVATAVDGLLAALRSEGVL